MGQVFLTTADGEQVALTPRAWAERLPALLDDANDDVGALSGIVMAGVDAGMAASLEPAIARLKTLPDATGHAAVAIASYLVARGERAAAIETVDAALQKNRAPHTLLARAKLAAQQGDEKQAERLLDAALDLDPNDAPTVGLKIVRGLARGGDAGARAAMKAIAKRKGAWLAHIRLGAMADAGTALPHLLDAKRSSGADPHVMGLCLRVLLRRGEIDDALKLVEFERLDREAKAKAKVEQARDLNVDERILVPLLSALVASERMNTVRAYIEAAKQSVSDRQLLGELGEVELALTRASIDAGAGSDVAAVPLRAPLHRAVLQDLESDPLPPLAITLLSFSLARGPEQQQAVRDEGGVAHTSTAEERLVRGLPLWLADQLAQAGAGAFVATTLAKDAGFYSPSSAWTLPLLLAFAPPEVAKQPSGLLGSGHVSMPSAGMTSLALSVFDLASRTQVRMPPSLGGSIAEAASKALSQLGRASGVDVKAPDVALIEAELGHLADLQALFFIASQTLSERAAWHSVRALDGLTEALARAPSETTMKRAAAAYACAKAMNLSGRDALRDALAGAKAHATAPLARAIETLVKR